MFTYEYLEKQDDDYLFARYYNNVFDGYAILTLDATLDMLRNPEQMYNETTESFVQYLKLNEF